MTDPRLHADGVTRTFGDVRAISDVDLAVPAGELTALVGPNGSGKTTLLRLLAGLLDPSAGSVGYDGPAATRRVGYLPQRPAFRPGFTARETLAFYAGLVGDDPDRLLDRVGLSAVADRRVEALSGGTTRLLGVAQALSGAPPAVVFDEPASGLDPTMATRVFETAAALAADGHAVVVSSHDLARVQRRADRVAVLDRGELVTTAPPDQLRDEWGGPLVETFADAVGGDGVLQAHADADREVAAQPDRSPCPEADTPAEVEE
ncbi:ABC transporter ATP-binding protein [Halobaculum sp. MBLA0143]|uniref:ABC transporter ATP-binding protein n=1 Tax=Halobaculum sp. MBLA0143 TaxID=3079933 RepID=UPI003523253D